MAYDAKTWAKVKADYETGNFSAPELSEKYTISEPAIKKHIVEERTPCNVCHDPHGISGSQGNSTNHSHLINFDISVVSKSRGKQGRFEFIDNGNYAGQCYLDCHGRNHNPKGYN